MRTKINISLPWKIIKDYNQNIQIIQLICFLLSFDDVLILNKVSFVNSIYSISQIIDTMKKKLIKSAGSTGNTTAKKNNRSQPKTHLKKTKKSCENTASTLGSRSSMDSKLTKRRNQNLHHFLLENHKSNFFKQKQSSTSSKCFQIPLAQNSCSINARYGEGLISYRQYCLMGDRWIPLITETQRQRITNPVRTEMKMPKQDESNVVLNNTPESVRQQQKKLENENTEQKNIEGIIDKLKQELKKQQTLLQMQNCKKNYYFNILRQAAEKLCPEGSLSSYSRIVKAQKCMSQHVSSSNSNQSYQDGKPGSYQQMSPVKLLEFQQQAQKNAFNLQSVEEMIKVREFQQLGFSIIYQQPNQQQQYSLGKVNTGIYWIVQYFKQLIQTIQVSGYTHQLISALKMAWGWPKLQKLTRLRTGKYLGSNNEILPDYIFQLNEDNLENNCIYKFIHNKCIFDFINKQLHKLKPFYDSNGQTFPWNFRLSTPLTFFQIQLNTINIAFQQIKSKLIENISFLCGIFVQVDQDDGNYCLVEKRRKQRQDLMCKKFVQTDEIKFQQQNALENESTMLMMAVSDQIFLILLAEFQQLPLINKK